MVEGTLNISIWRLMLILGADGEEREVGNDRRKLLRAYSKLKSVCRSRAVCETKGFFTCECVRVCVCVCVRAPSHPVSLFGTSKRRQTIKPSQKGLVQSEGTLT